MTAMRSRIVLSRPWQHRAACRGRDPELFFPKRGQRTEPARVICRDCPVQSICLEWAVANRIRDGIWGGKSGRERRGLNRQANVLGIDAASSPVIGDCTGNLSMVEAVAS